MYSVVFEMEENMPFMTTWMNLGNVMLTGGHYDKGNRSDTERQIFYDILISRSQKNDFI